MENPMTMFHKDAQRSCLFESTSWFVQLGPRGKSDWSKFWAQEFIKGNKGRQCIKNSTASDLTSEVHTKCEIVQVLELLK